MRPQMVVQFRMDVCVWCGQPLPKGRYDRRTHDACRSRLHRWHKKLQARQAAAQKAINEIVQMMDYPISYHEGVDALVEVKKTLQEAYNRQQITVVK